MKKYEVEKPEHYNGAIIAIMKPRVINVEDGPPLENVAPEVLCRNGNPQKYKDCDDYNTEFCRKECEFGPKEVHNQILPEG